MWDVFVIAFAVFLGFLSGHYYRGRSTNSEIDADSLPYDNSPENLGFNIAVVSVVSSLLSIRGAVNSETIKVSIVDVCEQAGIQIEERIRRIEARYAEHPSTEPFLNDLVSRVTYAANKSLHSCVDTLKSVEFIQANNINGSDSEEHY